MNQDRVQILLDNIFKLSSGDFNINFPMSDKQDEIEAIGLGLDMLADELRSITVSKDKYYQNQNRFRNLLEDISEGVIEADNNNNITYFNGNALKILGLSGRELEGLDVGNLFLLSESLQPMNLQLLEDGKHHLVVHYVNESTESERIISLSINVAMDQQKFLISFTDITDIREKEAADRFAIINTEEKERQRIAYELHDGIGQMLNAVSFKMDILANQIGKDQNELFKEFLETKNLLIRTIRETRSITKALTPISIYHGIDKSIQILVNEIMEVTENLKINYKSNLNPDRFNSTFELSAYRILQEALNNGIKHSNSTSIHIEIDFQRSNHKLVLRYLDEGIGFDPDNVAKSVGFRSINDRVKAFEGQIKLTSSPGNGTQIVAEFDTSTLYLPFNHTLEVD